MFNLKTLVLATACVMFLTACSTAIVANDQHNECSHCVKPTPPYSDTAVADYILCQHKRIATCRALLGKKGG